MVGTLSTRARGDFSFLATKSKKERRRQSICVRAGFSFCTVAGRIAGAFAKPLALRHYDALPGLAPTDRIVSQVSAKSVETTVWVIKTLGNNTLSSLLATCIYFLGL